MRRIGIEKIICLILICIIIIEGIYIFLKSNNNRSRGFLCAEAYSCNCGENNELEMCDCKYCENYDFKNKKCLLENKVQCKNTKLEDKHE